MFFSLHKSFPLSVLLLLALSLLQILFLSPLFLHAFSSSVTFTVWLLCFLSANPMVLLLQPLTQVWPRLSTTTRWLCSQATVALTRPTCSPLWRPQPAPAAPVPCTWSTYRQWTVSLRWSHTWPSVQCTVCDTHTSPCALRLLIQDPTYIH